MPTTKPIIGMNLSSSQIELMQSWGLGHSGRKNGGLGLSTMEQACPTY
jgi:hypothetical protein